jgi:hypothetical protein
VFVWASLHLLVVRASQAGLTWAVVGQKPTPAWDGGGSVALPDEVYNWRDAEDGLTARSAGFSQPENGDRRH